MFIVCAIFESYCHGQYFTIDKIARYKILKSDIMLAIFLANQFVSLLSFFPLIFIMSHKVTTQSVHVIGSWILPKSEH